MRRRLQGRSAGTVMPGACSPTRHLPHFCSPTRHLPHFCSCLPAARPGTCPTSAAAYLQPDQALAPILQPDQAVAPLLQLLTCSPTRHLPHFCSPTRHLPHFCSCLPAARPGTCPLSAAASSCSWRTAWPAASPHTPAQHSMHSTPCHDGSGAPDSRDGMQGTQLLQHTSARGGNPSAEHATECPQLLAVHTGRARSGDAVAAFEHLLSLHGSLQARLKLLGSCVQACRAHQKQVTPGSPQAGTAHCTPAASAEAGKESVGAAAGGGIGSAAEAATHPRGRNRPAHKRHWTAAPPWPAAQRWPPGRPPQLQAPQTPRCAPQAPGAACAVARRRRCPCYCRGHGRRHCWRRRDCRFWWPGLHPAA